MVSKHMQRCLTSVTIKEIQTKTARQLHFTPVRRVTVKKKGGKKMSVGENEEKLEPLCIAAGIYNGATIVEKL